MASMQQINRPGGDSIDEQAKDANNRLNPQGVVQDSLRAVDPNKSKHYSSTGFDPKVSQDAGVSGAKVAEYATREAHVTISDLVATGNLSPEAASRARLEAESDIARMAMGIEGRKEQEKQAKNRPSQAMLEDRDQAPEKGALLSSGRKDPLIEVAQQIADEKKQAAKKGHEPSTIAPVEGVFLHSARASAEQVEASVAKVLRAHADEGARQDTFLEKLRADHEKVGAAQPVSLRVERNKRGELVDL